MSTLVHIITRHITNCKTACNQVETTLKYCQHINVQTTYRQWCSTWYLYLYLRVGYLLTCVPIYLSATYQTCTTCVTQRMVSTMFFLRQNFMSGLYVT